jgi:PST family polysaccharide transporter
MAKAAIQQPIMDVSVPAMAGLQDNHKKMRDVIYRGMEHNALIMCAVFVGIAAISKDLVPFLFGAKWANAAFLCSLLCLYALGNALQIFFYPALLASGVTGKYVLLNLGYATGVLIACLVGIQFGTQYLVLGLIINSHVLLVPGLILLRKRIGLCPTQYYRPCISPALGAMLMWIVVWTLRSVLPIALAPAVKITIEIAAGGSMYLIFQYYFNRLALQSLISTICQTVGLRSKYSLPHASVPLSRQS